MKKLHTDRLSFLWLAAALALTLFSYGALLIPLAAWLGPIFSMRFLRTQPVWRGFPLLALLTVPVMRIVLQGIVPMPEPMYTIFVAVAVLMSLVPYLLDRYLSHRLPGFVGTLVFPISLTLLEFFNAQGMYGTFGSSAYTQAGNLPLLQLLSVTGMWGIVFLMAWLAPVVNWAWEQEWNWSRIRTGIAIYAGILALVFAFGFARLAFSPSQTADTQTIMTAMPSDGESIATVNATFPGLMGRLSSGEAMAEAELTALTDALTQNVDRLLERTAAEAAAGAQVVYWAEGNGVVLAEQEADTIAKGQALADESDIYLGMSLAVLRPGEEKVLKNQIVLVDPDGRIVSEYIKAYPVPGGELEGSVQGEAVMPVVSTPLGNLAHVICFDMDHHSFIQQAGSQDADVLFAPSNDWAEVADLHADMAIFRAIENGVTLVRPTSNGHSIAADPYGRLLGSSDFWATDAGALTVSVPTQGVDTVYTRIGDAFVGLNALALLILIGWAVVAGFRRRRQARLVPAAAN